MAKKRKFDSKAQTHLLKCCTEADQAIRHLVMEIGHYWMKGDPIRAATTELSEKAASIRSRIESKIFDSQ